MIKQENTYLGADGLAYCKICGEPVEAFFPPDSILGMKKHFRQCACIRQKREAEEKAYKEREHCELVERNRKICFEEPRMYDRILEMCVPLYVGGSGYRSDISHEKMGKMKTFFATAESSQAENIIEQTGTKAI